MPFLLAEILNFQGSTHRTGVGSFSKKLKRGTVSSKEMIAIAKVLDITYEQRFILNDGTIIRYGN